jgi:ferrous iron transport protein A
MVTLSKMEHGMTGTVVSIDGGVRFLGRVTAIGLTPGCPVEILRNEKRQPVLLYSRDTMIAVGRREGEKIMLEVNK